MMKLNNLLTYFRPTCRPQKKKFLYKLFEEITWGSRWVIFFSLICAIIFELANKKQKEEYLSLFQKYNELEKEKNNALQLQEDLKMQINSQSDHAWIEMTLMKGLGLVPEGQTKVFFKTSLKL